MKERLPVDTVVKALRGLRLSRQVERSSVGLREAFLWLEWCGRDVTLATFARGEVARYTTEVEQVDRDTWRLTDGYIDEVALAIALDVSGAVVTRGGEV